MPVFASHVEQAPERPFFGVIRTRRIARRRPDAAILLVDQLLVAQVFVAAVTPFAAHPLVQAFGERLGQAIRERFGHDGVVVVVLGPEAVAQLLQADAARHGEGADVIGQSGILRRDEIGEGPARLAAFSIRLLPQEMESLEHLVARLIRVQFDVVADGVGRETSHTRRAP